MKETTNSDFDYSSIPLGYYDVITRRKKGIRSFWHYLKFKRIIDSFDDHSESILDIGCFAGTFLGMIPKQTIKNQIGVDILEEQIGYAKSKYETPWREFYTIKDFRDTSFLPDIQFDYITTIEVIEHLKHQEIIELFNFVYCKLKPGGKFIITTPNYTSVWPLLELIINKFSDVKYEEQHITCFNYFNVFDKLNLIVDNMRLNFKLDYKTTTHLLTPLLAGISYKAAEDIASIVSPTRWNLPVGSLILLQLSKIS
ncbi:MAG: class I SAM-dependent methyltransferase [bacterium]